MSSKSRQSLTETAGPAAALLIFCVISALAVISLYTSRPPAPLAASAPAGAFSAERAIVHVRAIAAAPRPLWSPGDAAAREYIIGQLKALGLDPQVQQATSVIRTRGYCSAGIVNNVVAKLSGTNNTRAVMLAAHYDSVPTGPGASDDGSGTATLLETLRALKAGPPLRNDVIFLFSDGEEEGLYGAHAFVKENPLAKEVGVALNFEARGASGPSFMFETSDQNGWLIKQFVAAAPYPQANSLTYALYKMLPNDTDMTEFKKGGMAGLNFAYIGDWNRYHTMGDTVQNLDLRSLQHDGSYALALARRFGDLDLRQTKAPDATYFNIIGPWMARYRMQFVLPLALIALVVFVAALVIGFRRPGALRIGGIILGLVASLVSIALAWAIGTALWSELKKLHSSYAKAPWGDPYNGVIYLLAFSAIVVGVSVLVYHWCAKRTTLESLAAGALIPWVVCSVGSAIYLPGGSFIFTWPLLFASAGLILLVTRRERAEVSLVSSGLLCATAAPAVVLVVPLVYSLYLLVSLNLAGGLMVVVALLVAAVVPQLCLVARTFPRGLAALLTAAAIGLLIAGSVTGKPDQNHRGIDDLFYVADQNSGEARWMSTDLRPDEFTSQFLKGSLQRVSLSRFFPWYQATAASRIAPYVQTPGPQAQTVSDETSGAVRTIHLHVVSQRQAPMMVVELPTGVQVTGGSINSEAIPVVDGGGKGLGAEANHPSNQPWSLLFSSVPKDGFDLTLQLENAPASLNVKLYDVTFGLPQIPGEAYKPRPDYLMLAPYMAVTDSTIVGKSIDVAGKP